MRPPWAWRAARGAGNSSAAASGRAGRQLEFHPAGQHHGDRRADRGRQGMGSSGVTYRSAAAGSIVVTGAQTAVVASDTTTFSGPTTLGANVSTAAATGGTQDITK